MQSFLMTFDAPLPVRFTMSEPSETTLILSQSDDRFYRAVNSSSTWTFDFKLFKAGDEENAEPLASSDFSYALNRSHTLRIHLDAGEYVVHVCRSVIFLLTCTLTIM